MSSDTGTHKQADLAEKTQKKTPPAWLSFATDFGPLLVFFIVYQWNAPDGEGQTVQTILAITYSTGAFMVAAVAALALSFWKAGRVSPMLMLSVILIVGFGALTLYFQDERFIQIKPTIIYGFFAAILFGGLLRGKAVLKYLLHAAFEGLSDEGWLKLSRNWAIFFVVLAVLNEVMRATLSFDTWLTLKVWGISVLSFLFTFTQIPMLLKHGFAVEIEDTYNANDADAEAEAEASDK
jgi:intracellular septation protein